MDELYMPELQLQKHVFIRVTKYLHRYNRLYGSHYYLHNFHKIHRSYCILSHKDVEEEFYI